MACDNKNDCPCTSLSCSRRGKCCECVAHHRKRGEIPKCFLTAEGEKSNSSSLTNSKNP